MGTILRIFIVVLGISTFLRNLYSLARRRMMEGFSVPWAVLSLLLLLVGIFVRPYQLEESLSWPVFILVMLGIFLMVEGMFRITVNESELQRKNAELEMQISLINEENLEDRKRISRLEKILLDKMEGDEGEDGDGKKKAAGRKSAEEIDADALKGTGQEGR